MHLDIPWYFIHVFIYLNITAIKSLWSQFYLNLMDRQEILTLRHPLVIFFFGGGLLSCKAIPSQQYQLSLRISYYCVAVKSKNRGVKKRKRKDRIREKRKDSRKDLEETVAQCSLVWCFINLASKGLLFITHVCLQHTNMLCCW